jgi:hypothetical protein
MVPHGNQRSIHMRHMIEHVFEAIESNMSYALFATVASFAMTGCLRLLWEKTAGLGIMDDDGLLAKPPSAGRRFLRPRLFSVRTRWEEFTSQGRAPCIGSAEVIERLDL